MALEFRREPTKGLVVLVASRRAKRPTVFGKKVSCPFDKGSEHATPPTKYALPNAKAWKVRAFDNLFHLVAPTAYAPFKGRQRAPAYGEHEVIVETELHEKLYQDFTPEELARVFEAYRNRLEAMGKRRHVEYVLLFKNHGRNAGASIEHEHAQLVSFPFVPDVLEKEAEASREFAEKNGSCLFCGLLRKEKANVLAENASFAALCPSFARFAFEVWIVPKRHVKGIREFSGKESELFMQLMRDCIRKVYNVAKDYNVAFHESPHSADLHFHAEIYPRTGHWAGVEYGAGVIVNSKAGQEALEGLKAQPNGHIPVK